MSLRLPGLQPGALPTELPVHVWSRRHGFEPAKSEAHLVYGQAPLATWILLRDWCRSEDSNLYLLRTRQLLLPLKPGRQGRIACRTASTHSPHCGPRVLAGTPPAHQVIRIVKEQYSSNDESRGTKKPRLHEPTGVFSIPGRKAQCGQPSDSLFARLSNQISILFTWPFTFFGPSEAVIV